MDDHKDEFSELVEELWNAEEEEARATSERETK